MERQPGQRIDELVSQWQQSRSAGQEISLESLCGNDSTLLNEVKERIALISSQNQLTTTALDLGQGSASHSTHEHPIPQTQVKPQPAAEKRIGSYQIVERLGSGGMGIVYKAKQAGLERYVALKMVQSKHDVTKEVLQRFRSEAQALAKLQHPHVVHVYEVGDHEGQPFLVLEYVNGGNLHHHIAGKPQNPMLAAEVAEKLARAMHAIHNQGIIHRDLKPANILLAKSQDEGPWNTAIGCPKITDFGLVKLLNHDEQHTVDGQLLGTAGYMAPEQAKGDTKSIGVTTDVYGLGSILYEMLTGRAPFRGENVLLIIDQVKSSPVQPVREINPKVPVVLADICMRCLAKEPADRYANLLVVAENLHRFRLYHSDPIEAEVQDDPAVEDPSHSQLETKSRWRPKKALGFLRKNRKQTTVALVLGICLLIGLLAALFSFWRDNRYYGTRVPTRALNRNRDEAKKISQVPHNENTLPSLRWVRTPPDKKQGLVVFGDLNSFDGDIHILFDVTLSMMENVPGGSQTKIEVARAALTQVLSRLPRGIRVSLTFFGASEGRPTASQLVFNTNDWLPNTDIAAMMRLIPDEAGLKQIRGLQTPLVQAIHEILHPSKDNPRILSATARSTLLVITDGVDNVSQENPGTTIQSGLLSCKYSNLELHIFLFSLNDDEKKDPSSNRRMQELAQLNDEQTKRAFDQKERPPPKLWFNIDSVDTLVTSLTQALRPTVLILRTGSTERAELVTMARAATWYHHSLEASGPYTIKTGTLRQSFFVHPGDILPLKIQHETSGKSLIVPSIADIPPIIPANYRRQRDGIQLTVLGQKIERGDSGGYSLTLQAALEQPSAPPNTSAELQCRRPALAWFTLTPLLNDFPGKVAVTVSRESAELAPMWRIRADHWPGKSPDNNKIVNPAPYRLQATWIQSAAQPAFTVKIPRLRGILARQPNVPSLPGTSIDAIAIRKNDTLPGDWLYVRCTHPPGQSVLMQFRAAEVSSGFTEKSISEEHRFFTESNTVTAWFDITSLQEQDREFCLDLYSLSVLLNEGSLARRLEYESADTSSQFDHLRERTWRARE